MFSFAFVVCLVVILIYVNRRILQIVWLWTERINSRMATFLTFGEAGGREEFFNSVYFSSCPIAQFPSYLISYPQVSFRFTLTEVQRKSVNTFFQRRKLHLYFHIIIIYIRHVCKSTLSPENNLNSQNEISLMFQDFTS